MRRSPNALEAHRAVLVGEVVGAARGGVTSLPLDVTSRGEFSFSLFPSPLWPLYVPFCCRPLGATAAWFATVFLYLRRILYGPTNDRTRSCVFLFLPLRPVLPQSFRRSSAPSTTIIVRLFPFRYSLIPRFCVSSLVFFLFSFSFLARRDNNRVNQR